MKRNRIKKFAAIALTVALMIGIGLRPGRAEQRSQVSYLRGPYNIAYFNRHNSDFRLSAGFHFNHGKQHDELLLSPFSRHAETDVKLDQASVAMLKDPPKTEPTMEYYGPYGARAIFRVYRAIDWTHMHHEQTYDILADRDIPWSKKKEWTDRSVNYYLNAESKGVPRSPAPLDVTMRRAGVMMKPYFTYFRNYYPKSNNFAYVAHWWHPAAYESMMIAGNGDAQSTSLKQMDDAMWKQVMSDRPQRMLLSREVMPRYSRLSPESANVFDNLHMLHGITYDILAYPNWTIEQKKAELYRVLTAMSYQPGDEKLARKFNEPYPNVDPRVYADWMKGSNGEMNRIMMEMMEEMMPMMMPNEMSPEMKEQMMAQFRMKMMPGIQEGEIEGSLHDAMMKLMPDMKMMPEAMEPGKTPTMMTEMMLKGWQEKYGNMPDIAPLSMNVEPSALPPLAQAN
jgi:hypothetical protein